MTFDPSHPVSEYPGDLETINPESLDHTPNTDSRGRPVVDSMSDSELLRELVTGQRAVMDTVEAALDNPMVRMMLPPGLI